MKFDATLNYSIARIQSAHFGRRSVNQFEKIKSDYDVIVIGAGLAGQTLALSVADEKRVLILCKSEVKSAASNYAQGGISAVYADDDSHQKHLEDTLIAGCNLNDVNNARYIIENGRSAVEWLIERGVPFTKSDDGEYHLTREGGHSERRILHVDDMTGKGIQDTLTAQIMRHPNITFLENCTVTELLKSDVEPEACGGVIYVDSLGIEHLVQADFTVLATGGVGQIFSNTTSPSASIGDGIPLAWQAGCRIANLEFLQFHPTCMYFPGGEPFLVTEAVRGEGGRLTLPNGEHFMHLYDERLELAPRDVVSRAIYSEMKKHGLAFVHLDISHKPSQFIIEHFPNIYKKCIERGFDITKKPIPVAPASHYTCGGVQTDASGRTDLKFLYCIGESACTGLHGANRLASNSLLECVVTAREAAADILSSAGSDSLSYKAPLTSRHFHVVGPTDEAASLLKREIRSLMWDYVGITRTTASLNAAKRRINFAHHEVEALSVSAFNSLRIHELRNMVATASIIIDSALSRNESRGCHYNSDFPFTSEHPAPTVLRLTNDDEYAVA